MKVLHVIDTLGSGGAEKLLSDLLPALMEYGVKPDVYVLSNDNNLYVDILEKRGIKVIISKRNSLYNFLHIKDILKLSNQYDILHTHLFHSLYLIGIANMIHSMKSILIYTEHSTNNKRRTYKFFKFIEKKIYNQYRAIISISNAVSEELQKWIEYSGEKYIIRNGINLKEFKDSSRINFEKIDKKIPGKSKLILMVGRFVPSKDHLTVVKSLRYLESNVHLLFAGEGPLLTQVQKETKNYNLEDRVHFLHFRTDIPNLIKTSDIVVLSSFWEGFGLVIIEAMASGKPIVVSDIKGIREVVKNYGIKFEPGNSKVLAKEIDELLKNKQKYDEYRKRSLTRAEVFKIENTAREYIKIYKNINE